MNCDDTEEHKPARPGFEMDFINKIICGDWQGCYEGSWKDLITPESFAHPAKMAKCLLDKILDHAEQEGWLYPGAVICDPFGGIGSTGILGAYHGYQVVCVELEKSFVDMSRGCECAGLTKNEWVRWYGRFNRNLDICPTCRNNAAFWYKKDSGIIPSTELHHFVGNFELHYNAWQKLDCPRPIMINGDSRRLAELIEKADIVVGSPPYSHEGLGHSGGFTEFDLLHKLHSRINGASYGTTPGQLGSMKAGSIDLVLSSPPYLVEERLGRKLTEKSIGGREPQMNVIYGSTPGNLGNLKSGSVDAVISSPPYADGCCRTGGEHDSQPFIEGGKLENVSYGTTSGNLGNLKAGDVSMVISSPPWEGIEVASACKAQNPNGRQATYKRSMGCNNYGETEGQLGHTQGETFWQAAKEIVLQCHKIIKDGGYAIWVVKDFVRNKKRVDFSGDWRRLCEAVGFETLHEHHAMLVKESKHNDLFEGEIITKKERKSFFRRLAESKGSPRIDFETVLCMRAGQKALWE